MGEPAARLSPTRTPAWQEEVGRLFFEALEQPDGDDLIAWLTARCDDAAIRGEVASLLDAHARRLQDDSGIREQPDWVPESRFGAYVAHEVLGRGGLSVVYRAHRVDGQFEREVALKVLSPYLAEPAFWRRIEKERQVLAAFNHPNIATLLDGGLSADGEPYLITELVDGQLLDRYADEAGLGVAARLRLVCQLCEAVEYAHRRLIVHGDIKPANIMVTREGLVKLLDFGTAVLLAPDATVTATRDRMLTPRYASPEQLRGARATVTCDTFALGVVAYELVTGAWPFGAFQPTTDGFDRAHTGDMVAPAEALTAETAQRRGATVRQLRASLACGLTAVLGKALAPDPHRRYQSARDFLDDLNRYLDGRAVAAQGTSVAYRARRAVRRLPGPIVAVAAALLVLLGLAGYGIRQDSQARGRLARIRDLRTSVLADASRAVAGLPVSGRARAMLVDRDQRSLDDAFADAPTDPAQRARLAESYIQLAVTQAPADASAEHRAQALRNYRRASSLVEHADGDLVAASTLVRARRGEAEMLLAAGEHDEAARVAGTTLAVARRVWEASWTGELADGQHEPHYLYLNGLLGEALFGRADTLEDVQGLRRALQQFDATVALAQSARTLHPATPDLTPRYKEYIEQTQARLDTLTRIDHHRPEVLPATKTRDESRE